MKSKLLLKKRRDGYAGWNERENLEEIVERLGEHTARVVENGNFIQAVDVGTLAMMVDFHESVESEVSRDKS